MRNIFFCIPFKSKRVSVDWNADTESLSNLIESIYSQQYSDLIPKIIIAGHEKPECLKDKDVEFIAASNLVVPETSREKNMDKQNKKIMCMYRIAELAQEGDYICIADADDLLHCELFNESHKLLERNDVTDLVFHTGYMFNDVTGELAYLDGVNSIFYKNCGSCIISKVTKSDIKNSFKFFFRLDNHTNFYDICISNDRKPYRFTFPAALYMHNSVGNLSSGNIYIDKMFENYKAERDVDKINLNKYFQFKLKA